MLCCKMIFLTAVACDIVGGGTGGREPGRIGGGRGTGGGRGKGESGSSKRAGSGREIRNANFLIQ